MPAEAQELHVVPDVTRGGWLVARAWFATAEQAEQAARDLAAQGGTRSIFLHDRYHRVRALRTG
jgi:hypothetical protein